MNLSPQPVRQVCLFVACISLLPLFAHAQSANDSVRALRKLEAKVEVGVTYREYVSILGDAKFQIKEFEASNEAEQFVVVRRSLRAAFYAYELAGVIWEQKINLQQEFVTADDDFGRSLLQACPGQWGRNSIGLNSCMSELWSKAANETTTATSLLRQTSPKKR